MAKLPRLARMLIDLLDHKVVNISLVCDEAGGLANPQQYTDGLLALYPELTPLITPIYNPAIDEDVNGFGEYSFKYNGSLVSAVLQIHAMLVGDEDLSYNYEMSLADCIKFLIGTEKFSVFLRDGEFYD